MQRRELSVSIPGQRTVATSGEKLRPRLIKQAARVIAAHERAGGVAVAPAPAGVEMRAAKYEKACRALGPDEFEAVDDAVPRQHQRAEARQVPRRNADLNGGLFTAFGAALTGTAELPTAAPDAASNTAHRSVERPEHPHEPLQQPTTGAVGHFFFFCALDPVFGGARNPGRGAASVGRVSGWGGLTGIGEGPEEEGAAGVSAGSDMPAFYSSPDLDATAAGRRKMFIQRAVGEAGRNPPPALRHSGAVQATMTTGPRSVNLKLSVFSKKFQKG